MGRLISAGSIAYEQLDFFFPAGSISRAPGVIPSQIQFTLFVNNAVLSWPLVDGTSVPDASVSAGSIYFNEIGGSPGFYSVRFFPDRVGFFRMVFLNNLYSIELIKDYDVLPPGVLKPLPGGLIPSTSRC